MGLYDSYRLSNSTAIPQFAGSLLPEVTATKKELDLSYDTAKMTAQQTGDALSSTPYFQNSRSDFQKVHADLSGRLGEIGGRKDYENMVPMTQELAREAAQKLRPFVEENARWQGWVKSLDEKDLGLDRNTKEGLMAMALDRDKQSRGKSGGMKPDPVTGEMKGGFQGMEVAKHVDLPKWQDDVLRNMAIAEGGGEWVSLGEQTGGYIVKDGVRTKTLTPAQIRQTLQAAYRMSPDVQAYVNQQAELTGWKAGKNSMAAYTAMSPEDQARVIEMGREGYKPAEAVEMIMGEKARQNILGDMNTFSDKYIVNDRITSRDVSGDSVYARKLDKADEASQYAAQATTEDDNPHLQTPQGLTKGVREQTTLKDDLYTKIRKTQKQIDGERDPQILAKLKTDRGLLEAQWNDARDKVKQYQQIEQNNRNDAASDLFGKSYKDAMKEAHDGVAAALTSSLQNTFTTLSPKSGTDVTGGHSYGKMGKLWAPATSVSKEDVLSQLKKGTAQVHKIDGMGGSYSIKLADGRSVTFGRDANSGNNKVMKALGSAEQKAKKVDDWVKINFKPVGVITNSAVIPKGDWENGVVPLLKQMGATDASGKKVNLDDKNINWEKTARSVFNADGNFVPVQLIDNDGKEVGTFKMDATTTNIRSILGKKFAETGSTEEVKRLGRDMLTQMPQIVRSSFPRNSYKTKATNGEPYMLMVGGVPTEVQLARRADNLFVISRASDGEEIQHTSSHSQAGAWLEVLEGGAAERKAKTTPAKTK